MRPVDGRQQMIVGADLFVFFKQAASENANAKTPHTNYISGADGLRRCGSKDGGFRSLQRTGGRGAAVVFPADERCLALGDRLVANRRPAETPLRLVLLSGAFSARSFAARPSLLSSQDARMEGVHHDRGLLRCLNRRSGAWDRDRRNAGDRLALPLLRSTIGQ